jgi:hypothetical protein
MALSTSTKDNTGGVQAIPRRTPLIDVSRNTILPVRIEYIDQLPLANDKATRREFIVYTGLTEYVSPRSGRKYLVAEKMRDYEGVAPRGALVHFQYYTGSHRNIYNMYDQWFVVEEGVHEYVLKDLTDNESKKRDVRVKLVNLRPVSEIDKAIKSEVRAEIMNRGLLPSEYDPVETLYYYWVRQGIHERSGEAEATAVMTGGEEEPGGQVEIPPPPEPKPQSLEVELASTEPTAVASATATATPQAGTQGLVKIYLLSMRLPSKYLVQDVTVNEGKEIRSWEGREWLASRLETIRRKAYDWISKVFAHVADYGVWIAVSDDAVKEAERVSRQVREELKELQLSQVKNIDIDRLYSVKAIPIYMEPEDAKELLGAALKHLSEDVDVLKEKIKKAEEERNKRYLAQLEKDLNYKQALLESVKKYLDGIK